MAIVSPRLIAATREQLTARECLLDQDGATHVVPLSAGDSIVAVIGGDASVTLTLAA